MARPGNHGIIIPRDRELLTRLYWQDGLSLPQIGRLYGVNYKSVLNVLRSLDIPTRAKGRCRPKLCIDCRTRPVKTTQHRLTKAGYGRRCEACHKAHRDALRIAYQDTMPEHVRERQERYMNGQYYVLGAVNPRGELGWIRKSKALLRTTRKLCQRRAFPEALQFPNAVSVPGRTSQT